jgi:hypothetical protein
LHRIREYLFPSADDERAVIDQGAYYDVSRERLARMKATDIAIDKERHAVATVVSAWASSTVSARDRAMLSHIVGSPGRRIHAWLPGLSVAEIIKIKAAPAIDIVHHIFEDHAIVGVRPVQPLEPSVLVWPRPSLNPDQQQQSAGGGPRRR